MLLLIGAIYYQLGNYEQCIAFNDRCILLDPHMAEAHANLANALQQLGNFDMAVIYYQVQDLNLQDLNLLCCSYQLYPALTFEQMPCCRNMCNSVCPMADLMPL